MPLVENVKKGRRVNEQIAIFKYSPVTMYSMLFPTIRGLIRNKYFVLNNTTTLCQFWGSYYLSAIPLLTVFASCIAIKRAYQD